MRKLFSKRITAILLSLIMVISGTGIFSATAEITTPVKDAFSNLVAHIDMNLTADKGMAIDASGNEHAFNVYGEPEQTTGPDGDTTALNFATERTQFLCMNNPTDFNFCGDYAISVTFKQHTRKNYDQILVAKRDLDADQREFQLFTDPSDGKIRFIIRDASESWVTCDGPIPTLNEWHTAVAKVTDNVMELYLDDKLVATNTITNGRKLATSAPISIGADSRRFYHCALAYISDVKIAIPTKAEEDNGRYYFAPTVTPDIHMDMSVSEDGAFNVDKSGNGNNPTVKGELKVADGYEAGDSYEGDDTALAFGHSNGFIFETYKNSSGESMDFSDDFSISATFKRLESTNHDQHIVSKRNNGPDYRDFQLYIPSDNTIKFILKDSSGAWVHCTGPNVSLNEWHTVVATVKSNVMQLYLDGVLAATTIITNGRQAMTPAPVTISGHNAEEGFRGYISDVKISDEAAKYDEIVFNKGDNADVLPIANGTQVFTDRNYGFTFLPEFFNGMEFNQGSIEGGSYQALTGGLVYFLTPDGTEEGSAPQASTLLDYGFTHVEGIEFVAFGGWVANKADVYCKQVLPGDVFILGKWAILVADNLKLNSLDYVSNWANNNGEKLYNGITLPEQWPPVNVDRYGSEMPVPYLDTKPEVININTGRQLFVDDFLIESTTLTREWHKAEKYEGNPIMKPETEVELGRPVVADPKVNHTSMAAPVSGGVWYDSKDKLYKMWYCAGWMYGTALATSKDGINWSRGEYDVEEGTNLVIPILGEIRRDSAAVILDAFTTDITQRYKMFIWSRPQGGEVYCSADGIHWGEPTAVADTGDRSTMFFNPFRNKCVYSIRDYWGKGRARSYSECDDLKAGASLANRVRWIGADDKDIADPVLQRTPELYNLDAVAYESIMLGAFSILLGPTNEECYEVGMPKITELHLGFSRDGFHWSRSEDRTAFIGATQSDTWDRGYLQSNAALCLVNDDELWFYYTGFSGNPELSPEADYPPYANGAYANASTGLATLRRDGFASMNAGETAGTLTTETVTFDGKYLYVNADAAGGSVKAEILDVDGNVIEGYSIDDCVAVSEDSTKTMLTFGKDLSSIAGQNVKLRFTVENAKLYSFWVTDDAENGASNGYLAGGSIGQDGLIDTADSYDNIGDINGDGDIDSDDLVDLQKILLDVEDENDAADVTGDGKVNILDFIRLKKHLSNSNVILG